MLLAAVLIGLIVLVYDRGWLPLTGPFVAVILASTLIYLLTYARNRRLRRASRRATEQLQALAPAIAAERSTAAAARGTGASDESLDRAAEQVELGLQRLSWGHEQGAVPHLAELATTARTSWRPEAPLAQQVERLAHTGTQIDRIVRAMLADAERRRPRVS